MEEKVKIWQDLLKKRLERLEGSNPVASNNYSIQADMLEQRLLEKEYLIRIEKMLENVWKLEKDFLEKKVNEDNSAKSHDDYEKRIAVLEENLLALQKESDLKLNEAGNRLKEAENQWKTMEESWKNQLNEKKQLLEEKENLLIKEREAWEKNKEALESDAYQLMEEREKANEKVKKCEELTVSYLTGIESLEENNKKMQQQLQAKNLDSKNNIIKLKKIEENFNNAKEEWLSEKNLLEDLFNKLKNESEKSTQKVKSIEQINGSLEQQIKRLENQIAAKSKEINEVYSKQEDITANYERKLAEKIEEKNKYWQELLITEEQKWKREMENSAGGLAEMEEKWKQTLRNQVEAIRTRSDEEREKLTKQAKEYIQKILILTEEKKNAARWLAEQGKSWNGIINGELPPQAKPVPEQRTEPVTAEIKIKPNNSPVLEMENETPTIKKNAVSRFFGWLNSPMGKV
ncbi:MAG: hypothetical protein ABII74_08205 [Elusimicrobiota bacterium]